MLCQEEYLTFQIIFIPGIFCHQLDQELLSYPLLCSFIVIPDPMDRIIPGGMKIIVGEQSSHFFGVVFVFHKKRARDPFNISCFGGLSSNMKNYNSKREDL